MPLQAVQNRSLADQVFAQLASEILGGRYAPFDALPAERELAQTFRVNRHVVREALKRLAQANLLKIVQGGATRVLDYEQHGGLELLALIAEHQPQDEANVEPWLAVLEMRAGMAAEVARLCALRATQALRHELLAISEKMQSTTDPQELYTLEIRFWDRVLVGAENLAYRLAFNSLLKSAYRKGERARELSVYEVRASGCRAALARAIADGDADLAEAETRKRMRADLELFSKVMRRHKQHKAEAPAAEPPPRSPAKRKAREATKASRGALKGPRASAQKRAR